MRVADLELRQICHEDLASRTQPRSLQQLFEETVEIHPSVGCDVARTANGAG
jgi:hypothetical protein